MKLVLVIATLLVATTTLTACMQPKPGQYPPSMSMERDSMPDNVDKAEQNKK
ncbi:hypothetical protein [Nitrosomonas sp.]|uniref:hypothetical protein n=1 Tax=Nitrosomonas sp. TaxID=42353 RepID=UPI0025DFC63F|nr:hypothetical protein [Nitrosomonas sp.]MBE7527062.1 hypothetical protein [Burkholderiales bacterium]